jgi:glycosyltransferase involved in cell wall biosynthesis
MPSSSRVAEMRDVVVYAGGFRLPDGAASGQRCLGNARLLRSIGFRPLVLGKLPDQQPAAVHACFDGIECREIRGLGGSCNYERSAKPVLDAIANVGVERVHSVQLYNYPALGLALVMRACRKLGIPVIVECTEWYGWEGVGLVRNLRRILESRWRATYLARRAGNIVCTTHWFAGRHPGSNVFVLPFVMDRVQNAAQPGEARPTGAGRMFIYSGSPGLGMSKDRLQDAISAFARMHAEGMVFRFVIVGIRREDYLAAVPGHVKCLESMSDAVVFMGRVPRAEAVSLLRGADFSVFFRNRNRTSEVGFPTKYAEATTFGIPVISNRTSDIANYLHDGRNGFLVENDTHGAIEAALRRAVTLSQEQVDRMKDEMARDDSFCMSAWQDRARAFMSRVRLAP